METRLVPVRRPPGPVRQLRRQRKNRLRVRDKWPEILAGVDGAWALGLAAVAPICNK